MAKINILAADTETSGLSDKDHQLQTVTIVAIDPDTKMAVDSMSFTLRLRGDHYPTPAAILSNKLHPLAPGASEALAAKKLREFVKKHGGDKSPWLGYNIDYDLRFLRTLLSRNGYSQRELSYKTIDVMKDMLVAFDNGMIHPDRFLKRDKEGVMKPTMSLVSGAVALGVSPENGQAHTSRYDINQTIKAWRRLGAPLGDVRKGPENNPYELREKYAGRAVELRLWDGLRGDPVVEKYYVAPKGPGNDGPTALLVKLTGEDAEKFRDDLQKTAEGKKKGGVAATTIDKAHVLRGFDGGSGYGSKYGLGFQVVDLDPKEAEVAAQAAQLSADLRIKKQTEDRNSLQSRVMAKAQKNGFKGEQGTYTDLQSEEFESVPALARSLAGKTRAERIESLMALSEQKGEGRGIYWGQSMLSLIERHGYRNAMPGYEEALVEEISDSMGPQRPLFEKIYSDGDLAEAGIEVAPGESLRVREDPSFALLHFEKLSANGDVINGKQVYLIDDAAVEKDPWKMENYLPKLPLVGVLTDAMADALGVDKDTGPIQNVNKLRMAVFKEYDAPGKMAAMQARAIVVMSEILTEKFQNGETDIGKFTLTEENISALNALAEKMQSVQSPEDAARALSSAPDTGEKAFFKEDLAYFNEGADEDIAIGRKFSLACIGKGKSPFEESTAPQDAKVEAPSPKSSAPETVNPSSSGVTDEIKAYLLRILSEQQAIGSLMKETAAKNAALEESEAAAGGKRKAGRPSLAELQEDGFSTNCKLCGTAMHGRSGIAGYGPDCARKLLLSAAESKTSTLSTAVSDSLFLFKNSDASRPTEKTLSQAAAEGRFDNLPIVEIESGDRKILIDVIGKTDDGRFFGVDVTGLSGRLAKLREDPKSAAELERCVFFEALSVYAEDPHKKPAKAVQLGRKS